MEKRSPIDRSRYINEHYKEYIRSSFKFGSERLQRLFEDQLESEDLFKGPFLDLGLPFERGKTLRGLIEEGIVSDLFLSLEGVDLDRPLYAHQEKSVRRICSGRNAIITTGTGSGKTESFLYPILNELMREIEGGNTETGIRALFLYPMNALVNDQVSRVREIVRAFPQITFGFFTGDTPEKPSKSHRERYKRGMGAEVPSNEILSREEIRNNPPHLLFTNFSMLEYLLIRPNDYAIFSPERLANWKFVVLDEAHSYNGTLGIEISYLMRRLTAMAEKKPRFILSSATLGEKGTSEEGIVSFADKLTSSRFSEDDIIFAERVPFKTPQSPLVLTGDDYISMRRDREAIRDVGLRLGVTVGERDLRGILYDLLSSDESVYRVYDALRLGSRNIQEVVECLPSLNEAQITALIDLINIAQRNGIELFSLKYHSFARPLAGAFVSLGKRSSLSLIKTNQIEEDKAFEVGNCRYCSAPYLIGRMCQIDGSGIVYLLQNDEVDIYENYGDNSNMKVDYFLLEKTVEEQEVDVESLEKHVICSRCGAIRPADSLTALWCTCAEADEVVAYRVRQSKDDASATRHNNIGMCPCCGRSRNAGVVKNLSLGKDESTAILAQMLLESMDHSESTKKKRRLLLSLKKSERDKAEDNNQAVKQFLAFSDSRSQASYFAMYFDANNSRILRKRLIWRVLEDNGYREMPVEELEATLQSLIENDNLFDNGLTPFKNAWIAILSELLKIDGQNSCEGNGLYHFEVNLSPILDEVDDESVSEVFGQYGFTTKEDLARILQAVYRTFSVDTSMAGLSFEERAEHLPYRDALSAVRLKGSKAVKGVRSFLPVKGKENLLVWYVERVFGCNSDEACNILEMLFNLGVESGLFTRDAKSDGYRIAAKQYVLKNYRNMSYYRCSKCGRITPHNLHDVCVANKCDGTLKLIDPDVELAESYYRNQYKTKRIERLVVQEHTAQIDKETAKRYQNDFKSKRINVLSCSTTFEMGIDIGSLETVFLRNVPPTPANYVQRAGRAGRRADSSAFVLTYCGAVSHDYTYFAAPEKMISGAIKPPYFDVLNRKIIVRHLMAACLGFFFRENPGYFESVHSLVFDGGIDAFKHYLSEKPPALVDYLDKRVIPEREYASFHNLRWFDEVKGNDEKLQHFEASILQLDKEYDAAQKRAAREKDYNLAACFKSQIDSLHDRKVINALSEYCVIPKYGFPIDVVGLVVYDKGRPARGQDDKLSRDLKIAISEYAPGSEIVVDKKKYVSQYVSLPRGGIAKLPRQYYCTCPKCEKVSISPTAGSLNTCQHCGTEMKKGKKNYFYEPVFGFKASETKKDALLKPKRSYAGEVTYIKRSDEEGLTLAIEGVLSVETSSNDVLLVMNRSSFFLCKECGYGEVADPFSGVPKKEEKHKDCRGFDCKNASLDRAYLGHRFQTDVARIRIPALSLSVERAKPKALSFMYAMLEGVCEALEIERTNVSALLEMSLKTDSYDILMYDDVPGGAGLVKRLTDKEAVISSLQAALRKVSQSCCDEDTSCYNCLRSYYNQAHHASLRRRYAKELIEGILPAVERGCACVEISTPAEAREPLRVIEGGADWGSCSFREACERSIRPASSDKWASLAMKLGEIGDRETEVPGVDIEVGDGSGKSAFASLAWADAAVMVLSEDDARSFDEELGEGWSQGCGWKVFIAGECTAEEIITSL
ncbi:MULTISPECIES: DEAD/DEAH box helicase [unclassified Adlercreutzia]|uniref:DEAD/DEAH box helicase n=1 Tax=unclassified Adlercreutzia TaxID=2636013 RepID=UPI0013EB1610|nr:MULTISPECIES: DEAD/DEAH box helicase [unclassified Adlercreutzia]